MIMDVKLASTPLMWTTGYSSPNDSRDVPLVHPLTRAFILDLCTGAPMDLNPTTGLLFIALLSMHVAKINFCTL